MRKIEKEMLEKIACAASYWRKGNTDIKSGIMPSGYHRVSVYLHNNEIGYVHVDDSTRAMGKFVPNLRTLRNWPTVTTKSRLRALGVNLTQSNGKVYIDGKYICSV